LEELKELWGGSSEALYREFYNRDPNSGYFECVMCDRAAQRLADIDHTERCVIRRFDAALNELSAAYALGEQAAREKDEDGETAITIRVFKEYDGRYAAEYERKSENEAGMGCYSATPIGAIAELVCTLIKVDEDKAIERVAALRPPVQGDEAGKGET
jgi:hypothetical protein